MDYLKIDPRLDNHPDVLAAGFWGSVVFQAILRSAAEFDKRGRLSKKFGPVWLARRMNLQLADIGDVPEVVVERGISACIRVGLLVQADNGDLLIPGWEDFYGSTITGAERTRNWRNRGKGQEATEPQVASPPSQTSPPSRASQPRHCDATPPTVLHPQDSTSPTPPTEPPPVGDAGEMVDGLLKIHRQVKGSKFDMTVTQEAALRPVVHHGIDEVLRRWRIALETPYPRCWDIITFVRHWAAYDTPPPSSKPQGKKSAVSRADAQDWSDDGGYSDANKAAGT